MRTGNTIRYNAKRRHWRGTKIYCWPFVSLVAVSCARSVSISGR